MLCNVLRLGARRSLELLGAHTGRNAGGRGAGGWPSSPFVSRSVVSNTLSARRVCEKRGSGGATGKDSGVLSPESWQTQAVPAVDVPGILLL